MTADHEAVYERRFGTAEASDKDPLWREIARHLQRYFPAGSTVLELAAGHGRFISNLKVGERWATDIRDMSAVMDSSVKFVRCDGLKLGDTLPNGYFDRVFMSNYLEHLPSAEAVTEQLRVVARLLKRGGQVVILQPNIRYTGAAYWDFIDHKTPLTERSLVEAAEIAGMTPVTLIPRFLPYTTKSRLPQSATLVRAYLKLRPAWRFFGQQTLLVAERPS